MRQFFIDNHSDNLILFFTGWGCDEHEFKHICSSCDVLILYDYQELNFNFDFSKYNEINMLSFSAGVFIGSLFRHDFKINKKVAISGNPYLFDEDLGLSKEVVNLLKNVDETNCDDFAQNYLIMTEEEAKLFNGGKRTIESCRKELDFLEKLYKSEKQKIKDDYDIALISDSDKIFNPMSQQNYYGKRCKIVKNARHNIFFRIKNYSEIFNMID